MLFLIYTKTIQLNIRTSGRYETAILIVGHYFSATKSFNNLINMKFDVLRYIVVLAVSDLMRC